MDSITVNIIPLDTNAETNQYDRFLLHWKELCKIREWNGVRISFNLQYHENDIIRISGGSRNISEKTIVVKSDPFVFDRILSEKNVKEFESEYHVIILLCDTQELQERYDLQRKVVDYRRVFTSCSDNLFLFLTDIDHVVNIPSGITYSRSYIGACNVIFGKEFFNVGLRDGKEALSWFNIFQDFVFLSSIGNEIRFPRNVVCSLSAIEHSGYLELLILVINKLLAPDLSLTDNVLNTVNLYNKFSINTNNMKKIRLAVIGNTGSGKSIFSQDLMQCFYNNGMIPSNPLELSHEKRPYIIDFLNGILDEKRRRIKQTETSATQYPCICVLDQQIVLEILDIPGEIFNKNNYITLTSVVSTFLYKYRLSEIELDNIKNNSKEKVKLSEVFADKDLYAKYDIKNVAEQIIKLYKSTTNKDSTETVDGNSPNEDNSTENKSPKTSEDNSTENKSPKTSEDNSTENKSPKAKFSFFMKEVFPFYYYISSSTDVVFCHNVAKGDEANSLSKYVEILYPLLDMKNDIQSESLFVRVKKIFNKFGIIFRKKIKQNLYLNIKGVDCMMSAEKMKAIFKSEADELHGSVKAYSKYALMLYKKIFTKKPFDGFDVCYEETFLKENDQTRPLSIEEEVFYGSLNIPDEVKGAKEEGQTNQCNEQPQTDKDKKSKEKKIVEQLRLVFTRHLKSFFKRPNHIFFTGTPIKSGFEGIDSFTVDPDTKTNTCLKGDTWDPAQRELFGTIYFMADMLKRHKIEIPFELGNAINQDTFLRKVLDYQKQ